MSSGSAGTLLVTVGAQMGTLASSMKQGEESIRRFRRTVDAEADSIRRSTGRIGSGFEASSGQIGRSARSAVAGLALLTQASDSAAGGVARLAGTIATGFAVGSGPGAIVAGLAEGFGLVAGSIRKSREEAEALRQSLAAADLKRLVDASAAGVASARALGERSAAFSAFTASNTADVRRAGMTDEQKRAADDAASVEDARARFGPYGAASRRDAVAGMRAAEDARAQEASRAQEADRRRAAETAINRELGDRERILRVQAGLTEEQARWARDYMQIQDLIAAGDTRRAAQLRSIVEAEQAVAKAARDKQEADQKQRDAAREAERVAKAQKSADQDAGRRVRDLQTTTELQRILNRQADERASLEERGLNVDKVRAAQAFEIATFRKREADETSRTAEAAERIARAEADAVQNAKFRADQDQRAAADSARRADQAATVSAYGSGYGPLAMARDAKRRSRAIERGKRHAANLAAEARESMGYGTMGATQYDEAGNPISVNFNRPKKAAEVFPFAAPGTFNPAYFGANPAVPNFGGGGGGGGGTGGGGGGAVTTPSEPALKAAGDAVQNAGTATQGAAETVGMAAQAIETGATDIAEGVGVVEDNVASIGEAVGTIASGFTSMADALTTLREDFESFKATVAASAFFAPAGG